jgi:phenylalanyl-tRNA synthetase alpha chain
MLAKGVPDIRLPRSTDPRVAGQMRDLGPYRAVSAMPPVRRDLTRTLTTAQANELRDRIYAGLHEGARHEWSTALSPRRPAPDRGR